MSAIIHTKKMLVERVQNHMANGMPGADSTLTDSIVLLYIDQALAFNLIGSVYSQAKVEGNLCMPEAYLTTYLITDIQQDSPTGYWYVTLPQPPVSLPLGYSITDVYFAKTGNGKSQPVLPIESKRVAYREFMKKPVGVRYWVEGSKMWLAASNGQPLLNQNLYVQLAKSRTDAIDEILNMPDDAISNIFNDVIIKCKDRLGIPQDTILDGLPAGNKTS